MSEADRKRAIFIMVLLMNTIISFSAFVDVSTQLLLQKRGKKRRRDEDDAGAEDEDLAVAIATTVFEEWPACWTNVKSIHFVTRLLDGSLMPDDEDNQEFKTQFRLSRKSFGILHHLLRILLFRWN